MEGGDVKVGTLRVLAFEDKLPTVRMPRGRWTEMELVSPTHGVFFPMERVRAERRREKFIRIFHDLIGALRNCHPTRGENFFYIRKLRVILKNHSSRIGIFG